VLRHDGVHAVLSVPVQVAQGTVGSLNFYLAEPHEWDHSERNAAEVYGRLAGALLGNALTAELSKRPASAVWRAVPGGWGGGSGRRALVASAAAHRQVARELPGRYRPVRRPWLVNAAAGWPAARG
jgi:hypothetical protein